VIRCVNTNSSEKVKLEQEQTNPGMMVQPIIPAFGRLRYKDSKFEASLGYITKPLKKKRGEEEETRIITVKIIKKHEQNGGNKLEDQGVRESHAGKPEEGVERNLSCDL
jgi:hypothetical protein